MANGNAGGIVVSTTDMRKIRRGLQMTAAELRHSLIEQLAYIGEQAVKTARDAGQYQDRTGNLRSSIGYVVLQDGREVTVGAPEQFSGTDGDGSEGVATSKAMLKKLQGQYPKGLVLAVCAGMNYAVYVEAVHHLDVLTSAELIARKLADDLLSAFTE